MNEKKYSAGAVKHCFWFSEFRKVVDLRAAGKTWEEIKELNGDLPDKSELKRFWSAVLRDENEKTSTNDWRIGFIHFGFGRHIHWRLPGREAR